VNKSDLVDAIAKSAEISKAAAGRALDATVDTIKKALKKGDTVSLVGFGTFKVGKRAARNGRNPRTGAREHARKLVHRNHIVVPGKLEGLRC
jgi:DNA-binding protein HU-beta